MEKTICFPHVTKKEAQAVARRCTHFLKKRGVQTIVMIVRNADGWNVEIDAEVARLWHSIVDIATGS